MASVFCGLRSVAEFVWQWSQVSFKQFSMDTLNTLLLGWLVFGVFMVLLAKFLYEKFLSGDQTDEDEGEYYNDNEGPKLPSEGCKGPEPSDTTVKISKRATIVPRGLPEHNPAPLASGGDPDAVRWINNLLVWIYEGKEGGAIVKEAWNDSLNEFTVGAAIETGVLIEILEFLPQTPSPVLTNIIVDCSPNDDLSITCDLTATLYMRVQTTRTQRDVTTESEYACAVTPLRGRLNVSMRTDQCRVFMKFDGWPEVHMELEGIRNNAEGLDETQLQEVVKEELTAALRKVSLDLDFTTRKTFPKFVRGRCLPDHVMPVGYDALVRERQTHPPSFETKAPMSRTPILSRAKTQVVKETPTMERNSIPVSSGTLGGEPISRGASLTTPSTVQSNNLTANKDSPLQRNLEQTPKNNSLGQVPENPQSRFSMVFSSREKPIDEPNGIGKGPDEPDDEDDEFFFDSRERNSLPGPSLPPRNPVNDLEDMRESLKDKLRNNPFSKHHGGLNGSGGAFGSSQTGYSGPPVGIVGLNGKRLLVKVVKASGLGGDAGVSACYAVVEMDEPPQKFQTNIVTDSSAPFWDEQFLFDLSDNTLELLFELYDKSNSKFLGLGIVGIEELVATPSQRQIIPLQERPYEKDQVTGSLTCEFLFLDRADLSLRKNKLSQNAIEPKTTTVTYVKTNDEKQYEEDGGGNNDMRVAEAALKDLEGRQNSTPAALRSTLIIHASRKPNEEPSYEEDDDENYKPGVSSHFGFGASTTLGTSQKSPGITSVPSQGSKTYNEAPTVDNYGPDPSLPSPTSNGIESDDRGRSRNRNKRDFFGSLRRRFSRSKVRSKSVEPSSVGAVDVDHQSIGIGSPGARSISMERSNFNRSRGLLKVPTGRGQSAFSGKVGSGDSGSTRSSLSGTSGLSSASTKTYINEASLLVVETLENGVIKHYLVPLSLQRKNKWRKKGTKLHIYNEHTFVAKHLSSSISCQVCQKGMGRRLGKQGYECRDCSYKCHKPCHVKTEFVCPNSAVNTLDLVLVRDEKPDRRKRLLSS